MTEQWRFDGQSDDQSQRNEHKIDHPQTNRWEIENVRGDAALLARLRSGDEVAFDTLLRTYGDGLLRYAVRFVHSPELAQDIVQDVFWKLWQHRSDVKPEWDIVAYLYGRTKTIALNTAESRRSTATREEQWSHQLEIERGTSELVDEFSDEAAVIRAEVWDALALAPPRCREIFMLVWDRQLPYAEIGHSLGVSERTVRNYVSRAVKTLFEVLGPRYLKQK